MNSQLERFAGPNKDIPRPPYAGIPNALEREMSFRVAVIAEEVLAPNGNTADEVWEALKAGRTGITEHLYPPYTDPSIPSKEGGVDTLIPLIQAGLAGTIKNFDYKLALKGILPIPEAMNKMEPY